MNEREEKEFIDQERRIDAEGGVRKVPEPEHGDPTEAAPPAPGGSVIGVRVGSEAAVESGTGPVLPPPNTAGGAFTRVRNKDLRERDEKEFRKRGQRSDGSMPAGRMVSISFEGVMMVDRGDGEKPTLHSGGYTGVAGEEGVSIRPLTSKEEAEFFGGAATQQSGRASDLVAGSGTGGGGNPMHRGDARGVSSATERQVGSGGVTSKSGASPASRPGGAGAPQGGGTTSKT